MQQKVSIFKHFLTTLGTFWKVFGEFKAFENLWKLSDCLDIF